MTRTDGVKKKKPPTFQHFPANRAKKLKKAWIDKAKIKSKWKAEKRKEGLIERSKLGIADDANEDDEKNEPENTHSDHAPSVEPSPPPRSKTPPSITTPSQAKNMKHGRKDSRGQKRKREQPEETAEPQSLRDLTREAYSRSSLHTFKSHPLKKGKAAGHQPHGEKGRGQPNMKLRMNAMLAKIKQDYA
ncbi:hypothetical protein CVT24_000853 [Panaeolus cyanescens]|uniref:rRNA-processing protein FYV7 n=1 Tax=Panaeolus cyanescens TaxID=181874 RepID=A0A409VVN1_9AGAR|nr:hypothetical protein CVT24_000853 [Panaeolus cyanescens]